MAKIEPFAFTFDYVHDFIIESSRIDRIAMWGFKPKKCDAFSILGGSRFYSLARSAFEFQCNTFMLVYNTFDRYNIIIHHYRYYKHLPTGNPFLFNIKV